MEVMWEVGSSTAGGGGMSMVDVKEFWVGLHVSIFMQEIYDISNFEVVSSSSILSVPSRIMEHIFSSSSSE